MVEQDQSDKELRDLLCSCGVPAARSNLCTRIVTAAMEIEIRRPQQRSGRTVGWLGALRDGLLVPRPALTACMLLLVGLVAGANTDVSALLAESTLYDPASYLVVDGALGSEVEMIAVLEEGENS